MEYLATLDKHREEWKRTLYGMGATSLNVEDLIQEMYLRTVKYKLETKVIKENGEVNKSYVWCILKTTWMDYVKAAKKVSKVPLDDVLPILESQGYEASKEDASEIFRQKMYDALDELDNGGFPYNRELFTTYVESGLSMRALSKATGITTSSIFTTIKNCKEKLREKLGEDYEDLLNEDFELITQ